MSLAGKALDKALEVYNDLITMKVRVEAVERRFSEFQGDQKSERVAFEARIKTDMATFDTRLRELESRMAKTEGTVSGALSNALSVVLLGPERDRLLKQMSNQQPLLTNGASPTKRGDDD